ncbi:MAG: chorismate lyase [Methanobacterium sp.]|nr:chorismate lyase [Methanobacterium sp.]
MEQSIIESIQKVEKKVGKLSNAQKILLTTDGSVTTILDVIKGHVQIETLEQKFIEADHKIAQLLNIKIKDIVNYRVVIIQTHKPLIYAISLIPIKRLENGFKEDLIRADMPIGRILKKHNIESRREIKSVYYEPPKPELKKIFKEDSPMLTRTYNIIHNNEILIWLKETFPYKQFQD